jgi:NADPH-dependent ferric siderophore reductase
MLEALPAGQTGLAFLEVEDELPHAASGRHSIEWIGTEKTNATQQHRSDGSSERGDESRGKRKGLLEVLQGLSLPAGRGHVYIAGEVQQVNTLKQQALGKGLQPEQVAAKAYWGRGKPNAPRGEPDA